MIENPNHNIVACSNLPVTLGGGYQVEIFTVTLINQPEGCPTIINRAFITDTAYGPMPMISLEVPTGFTLDEIRALASKAIARRNRQARERGLSNLLDAVEGFSPTEEI